MANMSSESPRLKLAVLTPRFPLPLNKGDRLRIYHQLGVLNEHFEIDLHCLSFREISPDEMVTLKSRCEQVTVHRLS